MAFHPPVHPEFVLALRVLDAFGMPYAEAWRLLRPVAARLGIPRPSYSSVRRIVIAERIRKRENAELLDVLLADLFAGRFPTRFVEHKVVGARGWEDAGLRWQDPGKAEAPPERGLREADREWLSRVVPSAWAGRA